MSAGAGELECGRRGWGRTGGEGDSGGLEVEGAVSGERVVERRVKLSWMREGESGGREYKWRIW